MARYVIDVEVALALAERKAEVPAQHRLFAPTLLRSQVLAQLFAQVQRGELSQKDADRRLNYLRGLRIRLLGDRALQHMAWRVAAELGWSDTFDAEYVALTKLQADALVTQNAALAEAASRVVAVATMDDLLSQSTTG